MRAYTSLFLLLLSLPFVAAGQTAGIPALGWVELRQVLGVPGSARLAPETSLPDGVKLLALHPASDRVLVLSGEAGELGWVSLSTPELVNLIPGANHAQNGAVWSPSGHIFALYCTESGTAQIFGQNPEGYTLQSEFPVDSAPAAVGDDGASLLFNQEDTLVLYRDGAFSPVGPAAASTFLSGSRSFLYGSGQEVILHDGNSEVQRFQLPAAGRLMLASPLRGAWLAVQAGAEDGRTTITLWTAPDVPPLTTTCDCDVQALAPAARAGAIHLKTQAGGPLWFADFTAPEPRVFFIPPTGGDLQ
jgi:hypothetical protein